MPSTNSTPIDSVPISELEQAAAYLEGLINLERRPSYAGARLGLDPARRLLARVGHPERALSVLHVAGSKGKGSVCLLAEAILCGAGLHVGTFTSPHLERWTERFRIDAREVAGGELARAVERLRPHVDALRRDEPEQAPSFFDATTAAALLLFAEAGVDRAILEVGLGGRLDSTNVVTPAVTCVTSIELEHTEQLGTHLSEIAGEKAGILKPGVPCVMGALPPEAAAVVIERASALGCPLIRHGVDFEVEADAPLEFGGPRSIRYREPGGIELESSLSLPGDHQVQNAGIAIAATRRLVPLSFAEFRTAVERALPEARLPGRLELLSRRPWVVVDSAHTPESARALAAALGAIPARRTLLVLSISAGKDLTAILDALLPTASDVIATRAEPIRSLAPDEIAEAIRSRPGHPPVETADVPAKALRLARERLTPDDLLCVAGSVYLAGAARRELGA